MCPSLSSNTFTQGRRGSDYYVAARLRAALMNMGSLAYIRQYFDITLSFKLSAGQTTPRTQRLSMRVHLLSVLPGESGKPQSMFAIMFG